MLDCLPVQPLPEWGERADWVGASTAVKQSAAAGLLDVLELHG